MTKEKNFELERLVLISDAVVAIAITLLALNQWRKMETLITSDCAANPKA